MKLNRLILTTSLLAALAAPAHAAITYIDAVEGVGGNTRISGGLQSNIDWVGAETSGTNNDQWSKRLTIGGNGGTIFQALPGGDPAGIPELTTTIALADGPYDVWVFFWTNVTNVQQNWVISTGLASDSLLTYNASSQPSLTGVTNSGVFAGDLDFTVAITSTEPNRELYGVKFENVEVTGGSLDVYVDMLIDGGNTTQRVNYDGVGYELIPEPSTALLGGLGLLALLSRRR